MQWSFSNKISGNSQFFSFEGAGAKDDKPKTGFEALASTGLVTITTTEAVDSSQKSYSSVMQVYYYFLFKTSFELQKHLRVIALIDQVVHLHQRSPNPLTLRFVLNG